jgi:hypothetical protein
MQLKKDRIDNLRVAAPCPMSWDEMRGDDRTRFCEQCNLHVYNISEMTRKQAEALIVNTEGRICSRLYKRAVGTVITKDCPVGLRAIRRRASKVAGAAVTALFSLCVSVLGQNPAQGAKSRVSGGQVKLERTGGPTQENHSAITGVLKDPNGAVVAGATVRLINPETKEERKTTSNDEGFFKFSALKSGIYNLEVRLKPFATLILERVTVKEGEDVHVGMMLQLGGEAVVLLGVTGEEDTMIQTTQSQNVTIFTPRKITRLPY